MNGTPRNGTGPLVRQYGTDFCPLAMWIFAVMMHAFPEIAGAASHE
jgi:hypothetical protein